MLKRLIEVALPLKEVSEQSAREKSIRHGHISTLHIWWARRPLAACRAIVFASLIPDPDDSECPDEFRLQVKEILSRNEFKPKNGNGSMVEDTPRNRCLEFIKYLVRWENSNNPDYIEPARKLIAAAHKILHPDSDTHAPKVLDPFAGGGAIPLEALRLGCESHAVELNPVAHLIELCTLVYPQKYGQPDSRPVPDYIKRLVAHNRTKRKAQGERSLFDDNAPMLTTKNGEVVPDVAITEEEYQENPLAADVEYWANWVLENARKDLAHLYPVSNGGKVPLGYLWAKTVTCPNPACRATIPLVRQLWIAKRKGENIALRMVLNSKNNTCRFDFAHGNDIDFDPSDGTMQRGQASCPFCNNVANSKYLQSEGNAGRMGQQMMAVIEVQPGTKGKYYRPAEDADYRVFKQAEDELRAMKSRDGDDVVPNEPLIAWSGVFNAPLFGIATWSGLFNSRQALAVATFVKYVQGATEQLQAFHEKEYSNAVSLYLALVVDRLADFSTTICAWKESAGHTFSRQALPMVWDYSEINTISGYTGSWQSQLRQVVPVIEFCTSSSRSSAIVQRGSSTRIPMEDNVLQSVITDPPYYDAVPYSDLSDFFYVWLKRSVGHLFSSVLSTPLTPKTQEIVSHLGNNYPGKLKTAGDYESGMKEAFLEICRVLNDDGICTVMFAHKTTTAWETLIAGLLTSGLAVTASWPIHTEMKARLRGQGSAALASSVSLVCRKRTEDAGDGLWDDVRQELKGVAKERLAFFWGQSIRGADFFISAIGPSLSVYGRYARVIRLSGEEVTVGEFLDEVRNLVTNYALARILHTTNTVNIDPESRFYVVWKWSYGDAKVPADESFKLAQALGIDTEEMWDKTGVLTKSGENVQCLPVEKRMKVKDLGEPDADGTSASLIDVLHRMCVFRDKGDSAGMAQFLGRSGQARNPALWLVAQAISETLPDGNKEKQLMQGLLNQQEGLEEATRQGELF